MTTIDDLPPITDPDVRAWVLLNAALTRITPGVADETLRRAREIEARLQVTDAERLALDAGAARLKALGRAKGVEPGCMVFPLPASAKLE